MNTTQARKLIGKQVTWLDTYCPKRGYAVRFGVILDVQGRNVQIDQCGMTDWKWLPDMVELKEVTPNVQLEGPPEAVPLEAQVGRKGDWYV